MLLKSLCIAFATYSRIPVPRVEWNEKNLRWSVCFFPLIGAVIALAELLWFRLAGILSLPAVLRGAGAAALPLLLTGGIHLDGFCDSMDGIASHQTRERMLEIMKDPNAGAFAVIYCGLWLMLYFAGWSAAADGHSVIAAGIGFVLSRALSGLALTNWQQARKTGMLRTVADAAKKRPVTVVMLVYIILCLVALPLFCGRRGAAVIAVNALMLLYYRVMSYRKFGGVTGDLAGFFVSLTELADILILALTEGIL